MTATTTATQLAGVRISATPAEPDSPWRHTVLVPATGAPTAELIGGGAVEAHAALRAATDVYARWAATPVAQRAAALTAIAADLRQQAIAEELATAITVETGKRIAESRAEIGLSAQFFDWFATAISVGRSEAWNVVPGIEHTVSQQPLGIVAVLTPWNFPVSIPARKIAPALAAGCPVLFKPSEVAPTSALRLAELVEAHLPPGVINTVVGEPAAVVESWLADPAVRGLSFTGSTRVGQILAAQAAPRFTRCVFELGGNAPFVVLDDADLDRAVELLMIAKYRNNGQSCIAANQVWVPGRRVDAFAERFMAASNDLVLGDPLDEHTTLGPLALPTDPGRLHALIDDASAAGAIVARSSTPVPDAGHFAAPAMCLNVPPESPLRAEEIFGPAVSINPYTDLDQVVAVSRSARHGLGGYVVGNPTRASTLARTLDVGIVGVNTATPNTPQVPFGGLKYSGYGWEGGQAGLDAFLTRCTVAVAA